ncbi:hypothetical protein [Arthrobacter sp. StoSoilB22]|uniref:hypothetical protein n=1 Tax=Arthrobacter sp. StoSoilB22 TaxID=2830996 RepID=UPI001CC80E40|nr:hypothetical protein [Arthrobacter sp. StoSoilB22]BCW62934.1 hypothetical protein StoSoilB22_19070 [Arthrobacter sp. StoSoilB22]
MTILERQQHSASISDGPSAPRSAAAASTRPDFSCFWNGANGHFTASPWEGLIWEADPEDYPTAEDPKVGYTELGRFLMSAMYGE